MMILICTQSKKMAASGAQWPPCLTVSIFGATSLQGPLLKTHFPLLPFPCLTQAASSPVSLLQFAFIAPPSY
jgi:hypothetical protein